MNTVVSKPVRGTIRIAESSLELCPRTSKGLTVAHFPMNQVADYTKNEHTRTMYTAGLASACFIY